MRAVMSDETLIAGTTKTLFALQTVDSAFLRTEFAVFEKGQCSIHMDIIITGWRSERKVGRVMPPLFHYEFFYVKMNEFLSHLFS